VPLAPTYFDTEMSQLFEDLKTGGVSFPLILKPKKELPAHLKRKFRVVQIQNQEELCDVLQAVKQENISFLIQGIIPGEDDTLYTFGSCITQQGKLTAVFTGRKLRQQPPRFGVCRVGESQRVNEIIGDGEKMLRGLKFFGISQVEFKFDARDSKYKLIEVNPRAWAWIALPIEMGVNLPYAFFCDALGIEIPQQQMSDKKGLWISLSDDLFWSLTARDGKPWSHCFKKYDSIVEAYYSKHDPKPGWIHLKRATIELARYFAVALLKKLGFRRKKTRPAPH
jgi:D-aspartate ligase